MKEFWDSIKSAIISVGVIGLGIFSIILLSIGIANVAILSKKKDLLF